MKQLLRVMAVLVGLLAVTLIFVDYLQWGTVSIVFGNDSRATVSFIGFLFVLAAAVIALQLLIMLLGLPFRLFRDGRARRRERLREELEHGVTLCLQGRWRPAYKCFLRTARVPSLAHSSNLLAAHCAVRDGAFKDARAALQAAREANFEDEFCVVLIQAEILLESGQYEQAAEHLDKLRRLQPDNRRVTDLLIRACEAMDNWGSLVEALPRLRKLYAERPGELREIELSIARERLRQAAKRMDGNALELCWRQTGEKMKPVLLTTYARMLVEVGAHGEAELVLREAIESSWDADYLSCYGGLETGNAGERLRHAERWFKTRPEDPALLLCLGKLYRRVGNLYQARHYLKASFDGAPGSEVAEELASVTDRADRGRFD